MIYNVFLKSPHGILEVRHIICMHSSNSFLHCFSTVCLPGTFGLDCKSICHCANEVECNHVNGSCADDVCEPGWRGNNCSIGNSVLI